MADPGSKTSQTCLGLYWVSWVRQKAGYKPGSSTRKTTLVASAWLRSWQLELSSLLFWNLPREGWGGSISFLLNYEMPFSFLACVDPSWNLFEILWTSDTLHDDHRPVSLTCIIKTENTSAQNDMAILTNLPGKPSAVSHTPVHGLGRSRVSLRHTGSLGSLVGYRLPAVGQWRTQESKSKRRKEKWLPQ